jgi:hypothetical protein
MKFFFLIFIIHIYSQICHNHLWMICHIVKKYTEGHGENSPTKRCSFGHVCEPNDVPCMHEGMSLAGKSDLH